MQINYRVSLVGLTLPDALFDEWSAGVVLSLTGNVALPSPPVLPAALGVAQVTFHNALLASAGGGVMATAVKNEKRTELETLLRENAGYVQSQAGQNLPALLSSGYGVASTNRVRQPLAAPVIKSLENAPEHRVIVRLPAVVNAKSYEAQKKNGGGWEGAGVFGSTRNILLGGFVPGQLYQVQLRAVGGSLGYSEWSQPVSIMVA